MRLQPLGHFKPCQALSFRARIAGMVGGKSDVGLLGQSFLSKFQVSMSRDQMVLRR